MTLNPLKQYFRRPSLYFRLPSGGKYYSADTIAATENSELPVYPMTAIDDITVRTPDAVFNGHAVADLIRSCVPAILDPWKINAIDLDAILIAIRAASEGEEMDIMSTCPGCSEESKYGVNLMMLMSQQTNIDYETPLLVNDLKIKFRPLTYSETNKNNLTQFELQKLLSDIQSSTLSDDDKTAQIQQGIIKMTNLTIEIIASTIAYIETPETRVADQQFILEFLSQCDKKTNEKIREYSIALKQKSELQPIAVECPHCSHSYTQPLILNVTDFFG